MPRGVTDRDRGYRQLLAAMMGLSAEPYVTVGIHEDAGAVRPEGSGATVAEYAAFNEFGMGVRERSFLRSTVDRDRDKIADALDRVSRDHIDGRRHVQHGLERVGAAVAREVKQTIRDLREPANAPATIALKGSSNPLIDTGRMRQSIDFQVHVRGRSLSFRGTGRGLAAAVAQRFGGER